MVPTGSHAVPFGVVRSRRIENEGAGAPAGVLLETCVVLDGQPDRIAIERRDGGVTVSMLAVHPAGADVEPITTTGQTIGARLAVPAGRSIKGLHRLSIRVNDFAPPPGAGPLVMVVRDPAGRLLAESLFIETRLGEMR